ncbi:ATPase [bacterium]|nr:ATPase [bacterium]MBU1024667.1 ATPase [bacterium]
MTNEKIYCGIDIGASATKIVLMNSSRDLLGHHVTLSGPDTASIADECRDIALDKLDMTPDSITKTCSTGYARDDVNFTDFTRTEISCHSKGCLHYFPGPITIVDIGGQDNKIITLNDEGKRIGFKLNRKCAAGTGSFLEEIANILRIPISEMNAHAEQSESPVKLGSFCTVFTKTEILTNFRRGDKVTDIAAGAYESVMRRIVEMDPLNGDIVLTGGVIAHNPYLVGVFERTLNKKMKVPEYPQLTGAIGAALYAIEQDNSQEN